MLSAFAVAAGWIPLPMIPDRMLNRIRGAVVQDTVARHGLSITTDARLLLVQSGGDQPLLRRAAEALTIELLRRLTPVGIVTAAVRGLEAYALGLLLDRYLTRFRRTSIVRIQADEALRIRDAIDRAVRRALSPSLRARLTLGTGGADDLRDDLTRWIDVALLTGATVPEYVDRRLEAAFDEIAVTSFAHG